jgi:ComF family protein
MIAENLSRLGLAALDLLYPPHCALCNRLRSFICETCANSLARARPWRCDTCWLPLRGPECATCAEHPTSLTKLRSVFRYEGDVRRLVHAFKFRGEFSLGRTLATYLAESYREYGLESDIVTPVPLTGLRRRDRGYNQAALMARELARGIELPMAEALCRRRNSTPQAMSRTAEQRRLNVVEAFEPAKRADVSGLRVLLIDDVATTGATLNACAKVLRAMGAVQVVGLTLARED